MVNDAPVARIGLLRMKGSTFNNNDDYEHEVDDDDDAD